MRRVILETPYAGNVAENTAYARACLLDCLRRGEAPIASHLLYTQVLDDTKPNERQLGINAGHEWVHCANATVVYTDRGISPGMRAGIALAERSGVMVEYRKLNKEEREKWESLKKNMD